jgi:hypothetical protein
MMTTNCAAELHPRLYQTKAAEKTPVNIRKNVFFALFLTLNRLKRIGNKVDQSAVLF